MAENTGESKKVSLQKSAERLTEEIQSMANYKNLYTEIQVLAKYTNIAHYKVYENAQKIKSEYNFHFFFFFYLETCCLYRGKKRRFQKYTTGGVKK